MYLFIFAFWCLIKNIQYLSWKITKYILLDSEIVNSKCVATQLHVYIFLVIIKKKKALLFVFSTDQWFPCSRATYNKMFVTNWPIGKKSIIYFLPYRESQAVCFTKQS